MRTELILDETIMRLLALVCFLFCDCCLGARLKIPGSEQTQLLPTKVLLEVVARSEELHSIDFVYGKEGDVSFSRTQEDLKEGNIDILWTATSSEYESKFDAIYFPIYMGTLGLRLAIIEENKRDIFKHVNTKQQLLDYTACQGRLWADTAILTANNIEVATSHKYYNLFAMLEGDRCDYFPRAVFEPWNEIKREKKYKLMVDEHIFIRYKMPNFFFVKKGNAELVDIVTEALLSMHGDGSYQTMFFSDPDVKQAMAMSNLANRKVFDLDNPFISQRVVDIKSEFWFDPLSL